MAVWLFVDEDWVGHYWSEHELQTFMMLLQCPTHALTCTWISGSHSTSTCTLQGPRSKGSICWKGQGKVGLMKIHCWHCCWKNLRMRSIACHVCLSYTLESPWRSCSSPYTSEVSIPFCYRHLILLQASHSASDI